MSGKRVTKEKGSEHERSEEDVKFVGRLIYDVLVYTLRICGLPETRLPTTDWKENKYKSTNFLMTVGFNILMTSLIIRDKWKEIFKLRLKNIGLDREDVRNYVLQIVDCNRMNIELMQCMDVSQASLELYFASWNEIILFFHHKNINIDLGILMKLINMDLINLMEQHGVNGEMIQKYYAEGICCAYKYNKWISNFIAEHAVPYGSRDDLSEYFLRRFEREFQQISVDDQEMREKASCIDDQTMQKIIERLGFLPHDIVSNILNEESVVLPENLSFTSILPGNRESPEPPIMLESSKSSALKGRSRKKRSSRSANETRGTIQGGQRNRRFELEKDDLGQMS